MDNPNEENNSENQLQSEYSIEATEDQDLAVNEDEPSVDVSQTMDQLDATSNDFNIENEDEFILENDADEPAEPAEQQTESLQVAQPPEESVADEPVVDDQESQFPQDVNEILDPSHPLLKPIQERLFQQLTESNYQLDLELREKTEAVKKEKEAREFIGVELYQTQHQLARLQQTLEAAIGKHKEAQIAREVAEKELKKSTDSYQKEQSDLQEKEKNLVNQRSELVKIHDALKQLDLYQDELNSKIALTKRTTLKSEDVLKKIEIEKKRQDYYVDRLTEQISQLEEELQIFDYRLGIQQQETKTAHATLKDATTEMEAVQFEKKQLLSHWKSSLTALERRDQLLRSLEKANDQEKDTLLTLTMELKGTREALKVAREKNEDLNSRLSNLDKEQEYVQTQIEKTRENKERLQHSYAMYTKTLEQTENEITKIERQKRMTTLEIQHLNQDIHKVTTQSQHIEMEIMNELQKQTGIEKQGSGSTRNGLKVKQQIFDTESGLVQSMNDYSRCLLEVSNLTSRTESLKQELKEIEKAVDEENVLIEQHEVEIRKRHDEMNRKQSEMDLLNRKFERIQSQLGINESASQGEIGPLEATIHNLQKNISEKEKESHNLQQQWLKTQNELVTLMKEIEEIREKINDAKRRRTVMERKKVVIESQFEAEETDIKDLQRSKRKLRRDMSKVNELLDNQDKSEKRLQENTLDLEYEFRERLKNAELESIKLEQNIDRLKEEKSKCLEDLINAERQLMLWDKKIQLAKETQEALDPSKGGADTIAMENEITRMRQKYQLLLKEQEKMVLEMERAIYRHGEITSKAIQMESGSLKLEGQQQLMKKALVELRKQRKQLHQALEQSEFEIAALVQRRAELNEQIRQAQVDMQTLENEFHSCVKHLEHKKGEKQSSITEVVALQNRSKRLNELKAGKYVFAIPTSEKRLDKIQQQSGQLGKLSEIVKSLSSQFPHVQPYLNESGLIHYAVQQKPSG